MLAKEGIPVILTLVFFSVIFLVGAAATQGILLKILVLVSWLVILFTLYFFRDPERNVPSGDNFIVSPADGKVLLIETIPESDYFKTSVQKVSIFMSIFNVHINRIPIDGQVGYFHYQKGKFHPAYQGQAPHENEQTIIVIENEQVKILVKQIAGILARRIVCHLREGRKVKRGERFGMIKFGSRIDLLLPMKVQLQIEQNDKVTAGESIIGTY